MIFSVSLLLALPVGASKEPEKDFDNLSLGVILRSRFSWTVCFKSFVQILIFTSRLTNSFGQVPTVNIKGYFSLTFCYRFSLAALED